MSKPTHWLDEPRHHRRLWHGLLVLAALAVAAGLALDLHPHFAIEALPGFHAAMGLLACAALIAVARILGWLLQRPDRHYGADDE